MDTNGLVTRRVEDGRKYINLLSARGFDVTAACWVRTSEEDVWLLYVASPRVDNRKLADAYSGAYAVLQTMEGTTVSASEVKLVGENSLIATEILDVRRRYADTFVDSSILRQVGSVMIEEAYVYGPPQTLRQEYTVQYDRQGQTNQWRATAERGKMRKDVKAKGSVAYFSYRGEDQTADDDRVALVSVILELDPRFDDRDLIVSPGVWQVLGHQAGLAADEVFRAHHPDALIEHVSQDED
jgi:hypothetical protein